MKLLNTFEKYFTDIKRYRRFNQQLSGRNTSTAKAWQAPLPNLPRHKHSGDLKESIMEKLIPTRIGKHRQGTQEEADKRKGYRFFMHSESKRPKKGSPENTNSETPTTNRHTSKERSQSWE